MSIDDEAQRVVQALGESPAQLLSFLSGQLSVIKNQGQMLLGLCGLAITVTGFSGAHMIRGGRVSAAAMVLGILLILVAAALCIRTLTNIRWVSQDLSDDLVATTKAVIERRNEQQSKLNHAGTIVVLGLASYLTSVAIAAFANA